MKHWGNFANPNRDRIWQIIRPIQKFLTWLVHLYSWTLKNLLENPLSYYQLNLSPWNCQHFRKFLPEGKSFKSKEVKRWLSQAMVEAKQRVATNLLLGREINWISQSYRFEQANPVYNHPGAQLLGQLNIKKERTVLVFQNCSECYGLEYCWFTLMISVDHVSINQVRPMYLENIPSVFIFMNRMHDSISYPNICTLHCKSEAKVRETVPLMRTVINQHVVCHTNASCTAVWLVRTTSLQPALLLRDDKNL